MSTFHGQTNTPGTYKVVRTLTETHDGFTAYDMRTDSWFGACPRLSASEKVAAKARGEVKQINISVTTGLVRLSEEAVPVGRYSTATATGVFPSLTSSFLNSDSFYEPYLDTNNSSATFEVEVWFDIPTLAQVA